MKRPRWRWLRQGALLLALAGALTACGQTGAEPPAQSAAQTETAADTEFDAQLFAMDTYMELRAFGPGAEAGLDDCAKLIQTLDGKLSVTNEASEIYALNHSGGQPTPISADTMDLLTKAMALSAECGGALEFTLYPVSRAWGFTTGQYQVPAQAELQRLLRYVDDSQVKLDPKAGTATLPAQAELDLGAAAKGYAGDRAAEMLEKAGATSALLSLGGSTIRTLGQKPDGSNWRIAVQDPDDPEGYAGVLECGQGAVNTSGGYERYFQEDGKTYWHILDPKTGAPAQNGLISVTILSDDALTGDALSTALFVMGKEQAVDFWRSRGGFEFVLIDEGRRIYVSPGAAERFTPLGSYADAAVTVIPHEA